MFQQQYISQPCLRKEVFNLWPTDQIQLVRSSSGPGGPHRSENIVMGEQWQHYLQLPCCQIFRHGSTMGWMTWPCALGPIQHAQLGQAHGAGHMEWPCKPAPACRQPRTIHSAHRTSQLSTTVTISTLHPVWCQFIRTSLQIFVACTEVISYISYRFFLIYLPKNTARRLLWLLPIRRQASEVF